MIYTQAIKIIPDMFVNSGAIISKVFDILHNSFVSLKREYAISFPEYSYERQYLGDAIVIGCKDKEGLEELNLNKALAGISMYAHTENNIGEIQEKDFKFFKRLHIPSQASTYKRRAEKRGSNFNMREAMAVLRVKRREMSKAPYVMGKSKSTNKRFSLFIMPAENNAGRLNKYGFLTKEGIA